MDPLDRIVQTPDTLGGRPRIRGTRISVGLIVGMLGGGCTIDELLEDYPALEREDVLQALRYAARRVDEAGS